jgi:S1-C subfamily serine protease
MKRLVCAFVLFMAGATAEAAETSAGSGVVISTRGEILTNSHVVEACTEITVHLPSEGNVDKPATLVARDERNDLAVIRVTRANIRAAAVAVFRDGVPVRAGDAAVALGYPLSGLLASAANVSVGNVSALAGLRDDSRYLQISAPVQPGNSGGPLLDASGHLIGIVTAKLDAARIAKFTGDIPDRRPAQASLRRA